MTLDTQNFQKDVIERSFTKPVLVDFWAEWCAPCKMLGPVLERLSEKNSDLFDLVKLNTDNFPEIASEYGVRGIPNVKLFVDGEVKNEFTGALPESAVNEWIKKNIPGKNNKVLSQAKELIKAGNEKDAAGLLEDLKRKEPENKEIDVLLARILLFKDPEKALSLIREAEILPETADIINSVETIAELLTRHRKNNFPEGEIKRQYSGAVEYLILGNFDKSLEEFIDIIRKNRSYDDDGARKACIAIFKYLGEDNPVTAAHRRDFGSALYV